MARDGEETEMSESMDSSSMIDLGSLGASTSFNQSDGPDEGGPSSVEAQVDPNDLDLDLSDLDIPETSFPLVEGPENDPLLGDSAAVGCDIEPDLSYFDFLTSGGANGNVEDDVKSDKAVAGVCGLRNIGNTCYMNSGLQCLLGTPPVVEFFLQFFSSSSNNRGKDCPEEASKEKQLSVAFGPLLKDVWDGSYEIMKPAYFKEALGLRNVQFYGTHQHDCQEFLAVLLDALHEELRISHGNYKAINRSDCGTSMELHTSHSKDGNSAMPIWHPTSTSTAGGNHNDCVKRNSVGHNNTSTTTNIINHHHRCNNGSNDLAELESGGSASPKSFDSHSSIDEKVSSSIRNMPLPPNMKPYIKDHKEDSSMEEDRNSLGEEDEDTMDSSASSGNNPTSNLVAPDSLSKRQNTKTKLTHFNDCDQNNMNSESEGMKLADYIKDTKTLNTNVLAEEGRSQMNNELNFDSDKFARHFEKSRPRETIDNLNVNLSNQLEKKKSQLGVYNSTSTGAGKRYNKTTNLLSNNCDINNSSTNNDPLMEFSGIKRMRLDSLDKEKNVQLEIERHNMPKCVTIDEILEHENRYGSNNSNHNNNHGDDDGDDAVDYTDSGSQDNDGVGGGASALLPNTSTQSTRYLKEAIDADRYWEKYLAANDTVVARTFQGLFKNTVICSVCQYPSVTFEPFMYLPVPLPNAVVKQLEVTLVTARPSLPVKTFLLDLTQADNIGNMKKKLMEVSGLQNLELQAVEVSDHRISRMLEDWSLLRHTSEDRSLCLIETLKEGGEAAEPAEQAAPMAGDDLPIQVHGPVSSTSDVETMETVEPLVDTSAQIVQAGAGDSSDQVVPDLISPACVTSPPTVLKPLKEPESSSSLGEVGGVGGVGFHSCVICMEEFPGNEVRQHNACDCVMCLPCLERTQEHHESDKEIPKGQIKCPGCRENADPSVEFVPLDLIGKSKPKIRYFTLPVLFRWLETKESVSNCQSVGYPFLVQVPNQMTGKRLYEMLDPLIKVGTHLEITLVDTQGKNCSRCMFGNNCTGCVRIHRSEEVVLLQSSDTIALTYTNVDFQYLDEVYRPEWHPSMNAPRLKPKLKLEECLQAFSEEEVLDDNNPWYCPTCRKNQCATKKLTVWKFPDFLIIHLKRFVFINGLSVKLEKPVEYRLNDMDLTPFMSGPLQPDVKPKFDLYACVNHYGTAGGGHYTAFCKHGPTERWNYYDDCNVVKEKMPGDNLNSDQSSAYVLFYQRKGTEHQYHLPTPDSTNCQTNNFDPAEEFETNKLTENLNNQEQNNFTDDLVDLGDSKLS